MTTEYERRLKELSKDVDDDISNVLARQRGKIIAKKIMEVIKK
jgi:hypothetical protein